VKLSQSCLFGQEEVTARLTAERRLHDAEQRLERLERGITDEESVNVEQKEEKKSEMIGDVKAIRSKQRYLADTYDTIEEINVDSKAEYTA